jgi:hypothetical protein
VPRDLRQLENLLKRQREGLALTVRQLTEAAGLGPSTASRNPPRLHRQTTTRPSAKVCAALGIDVEDLYAVAGYLSPAGLPELRPYLRVFGFKGFWLV